MWTTTGRCYKSNLHKRCCSKFEVVEEKRCGSNARQNFRCNNTTFMQRAFTLVEMLIVLVIIALMMVVTFRFGGNFVNDTSFKQERDNLLTDYHIALWHTLWSRYIQWDQAYDILEVEIQEWSTVLYRFINADGEEVASQENVYERLTISEVEPSSLILNLRPYTLWCYIQWQGTWSSARMKILAPGLSNKEFCYELHTSTCKRHQFIGDSGWCE